MNPVSARCMTNGVLGNGVLRAWLRAEFGLPTSNALFSAFQDSMRIARMPSQIAFVSDSSLKSDFERAYNI